MDTEMLITLLRHAEIQQAYQGRYIGHTDIALSDHGIKEATLLADFLIQNHQHKNFDAIYCSDLIRCRQTLSPLLTKLNVGILPHFTDRLREKSWGRHEGLNYYEICQQENTSFHNFKQWFNLLDGESINLFIQRIQNFSEKLSLSKKTNILIISHAGVIATFIHLLSNLTFEQSFYIKIPYASFVVLDTAATN